MKVNKVEEIEQKSRDYTQPKMANNEKLGEFGVYEFEEDEHFGMFVRLNDKPVFIELREDKQLDERKEFCLKIFSNAHAIEKNLESLLKSSADLKDKGVKQLKIVSIGLYNKDPSCGEVYLVTDENDEGWTCLIDNELCLHQLIYSY